MEKLCAAYIQYSLQNLPDIISYFIQQENWNDLIL